MKIFIHRNKNNDLKAGAQLADNFFKVTDEDGKDIGNVVFIKNIPLSFGGTEIVVEIDERKVNGRKHKQTD